MERWTSQPIPLEIDLARVARVDLIFEGVRRDGGSFVVFIFLNDREVPSDAGRDHRSFGAAFSVFAHTRCWGDEGHCDWMQPPASAFDQRPEHHLTPIDVTVDVTEAAARLETLNPLVVTVHAANVEDPRAQTGVFRFDSLSARAYQ